jgi:hypothetical protein
MVFYTVSGVYYLAAKFRIGSGALTNAEKCSTSIMLGEDRKDLWSHLRVGTVIDGDCYFTPLHRSRRQSHQVGSQARAAWPQTGSHQHQLTE